MLKEEINNIKSQYLEITNKLQLLEEELEEGSDNENEKYKKAAEIKEVLSIL